MGLQLESGLGASVFASGYPSAATPAAAGASPQGPTSIGQKAFGVVTGGDVNATSAHVGLISGGALALIGLVYIWWSLPR